MHEGAEMSEDLSLRSWIFSSKDTALMFCCYGNTVNESVYIIQSYNTDVYLIKKCTCITIHPEECVLLPTHKGLTHTLRSKGKSLRAFQWATSILYNIDTGQKFAASYSFRVHGLKTEMTALSKGDWGQLSQRGSCLIYISN